MIVSVVMACLASPAAPEVVILPSFVTDAKKKSNGFISLTVKNFVLIVFWISLKASHSIKRAALLTPRDTAPK
jgi:hypothetical protein